MCFNLNKLLSVSAYPVYAESLPVFVGSLNIEIKMTVTFYLISAIKLKSIKIYYVQLPMFYYFQYSHLSEWMPWFSFRCVCNSLV
jgi:hypothetical protein